MINALEEAERLLCGTGRYRRVSTSFGLEMLCFLGSDGLIHTLADFEQVNGRLVSKWEHGESWVLSHRRMKEVVRLVDQAEIEIQKESEPERLTSNRYDPQDDHERMFRDLVWEVDGITLSEEQISAIKLILTSEKLVTILTGQAGSGKSLIIRWLVLNHLATVCATTGSAALGVGGTTTDSLFCLDREKWQIFSWSLVEKYMKACHKLIVQDESSACGHNMSNLLLTVLEKMGKRLVMVGDWAQTAPVKDDWGHKSRLFNDINYIRLEECHRQEERVLVSVLNKIRLGVVDQEVESVMSQRIGPCPDESGWVRMFATNRLANEYNTRRLDMYCRETSETPIMLSAFFSDRRALHKQEKRPRDQRFIDTAVENTPFTHGRALAVGAQVLFCANDPKSEARQYANGDVGILKDVGVLVERKLLEGEEKKEPTVLVSAPPKIQRPALLTDSQIRELDLQLVWLSSLCPHTRERVSQVLANPCRIVRLEVVLNRTESPIVITPIEREFKDGQGEVTHVISGFPLRLGWAFTIHKCQGMTVDRAWFDMRSIRQMPEQGRHGLAYVGLSRVRTLEGLLISEWAPDVVYCDPAIRHLI